MSEKLKYPMQVGSVVRKNKTFGIDSALTLPTNEEYENNRKMPLEMHSGFSRFKFTIIDFESGDKKIATANIPADNISYIAKQTEIAMSKLANHKAVSTAGKSIAYTQKLFSKEYSGMTPAEVLLKNPEKKDDLLKTKEWLEANLSKYPKNKAQIDAIDDALKLLNEGKLSTSDQVDSADATFCVYKDDIKIPQSSKLDDDGCTFVYNVSIQCMPGRNYPFAVNIMNCMAPLSKDASGQITANLAKAKDIIKNSIMLTEQEWFTKVDRMEKTVKMFEEMNFKEQYKLAREHSFNHDKK